MADLKSMKKDAIVKYILSCENPTNFSSWYVGITGQKPEERKKQHEREKDIICQYFHSWNVFNQEMAQEIEKEIADLGISKFTKDLDIITASEKDSAESGALPEYYVYVYLAVENERAKDK